MPPRRRSAGTPALEREDDHSPSSFASPDGLLGAVGRRSDEKPSWASVGPPAGRVRSHGESDAPEAIVKADAPTQAFDVPLWPDRSRPSMRVVLPTRPRLDPAPAIVVFRGGAYASSSGSGAGTAEWVATKGMVGIEAAYGARDTNTFYPSNYADGARAIRIVRSRARE